MSSLKKGKPSERETARLTPMNRDGQVETVIDVKEGIISPRLKSWVNSKLRSLITVSTVFMIFKMRSKYFNFPRGTLSDKSFLSGLKNLIDQILLFISILLSIILTLLRNLKI